MWPFKEPRVKMCDCGTNPCFKPGHILPLWRAKPGVTFTTPADPYMPLREENERLRKALKDALDGLRIADNALVREMQYVASSDFLGE